MGNQNPERSHAGWVLNHSAGLLFIINGNIHRGKLLTSGTLLWQHQSDCRTKTRVHVTFCPLSKKLSTRKCVDYTSKAGEKQFSDVWKRRKSRESKIKVPYSWFAGLTRSPYFAAPSLHVQSASQNSTELRMS